MPTLKDLHHRLEKLEYENLVLTDLLLDLLPLLVKHRAIPFETMQSLVKSHQATLENELHDAHDGLGANAQANLQTLADFLALSAPDRNDPNFRQQFEQLRRRSNR